jgi:hypothetical protein
MSNRPDPPFNADERLTLVGFLDFQRATLEMKVAGLSPAQLRRRAVAASNLSLLGMVRHLADVDTALTVWREQCARSRRIVADILLDDTFTLGERGPISLRWVLVHLIEEYARHNGRRRSAPGEHRRRHGRIASRLRAAVYDHRGASRGSSTSA